MDALEAIQTRRSVRRYEAKQIDNEIIKRLLSAAMSAPSAANEQPWEFIVINDRVMLDVIPYFSPFASMVIEAPLGILVCADTREVIVPGFWVQDCSAATQNLLIAAHALGLGAVWTGVYPLDDRVAGFTKHCRLPEGVVPLAFVVLGYPAETPQPQNRFDEGRIHSNVW
ncbi:MAG: nitroreductase family protein [Halobacteriota archaeon]